jgi:SAM-dependent methyltransferase
MACGLAQNALYLAELGYEVDALDISRVALRKGQAEMAMRNLRNVNFILADLDHYMLPTACYDLVCVFYFRATGLFPALRTAIRPGGMIIYETFNVRWLETHPEADPDHLLAPGELLRRFAGWQVILATEEGDCSRFVCCKPPA